MMQALERLSNWAASANLLARTKSMKRCRRVQGSSVDCQATICQEPLRRTQTSV